MWYSCPAALAAAKESVESRNKQYAIYAAGGIVLILGLSYASVPLYQMFCQVGCVRSERRVTTPPPPVPQLRFPPAVAVLLRAPQATGYGGTLQTAKDTDAWKTVRPVEGARPITVYFNADTSSSMPWKFTPLQHAVKVCRGRAHPPPCCLPCAVRQVLPGEHALAFYKAVNPTDKPITGVSTYNVTPMRVGACAVLRRLPWSAVLPCGMLRVYVCCLAARCCRVTGVRGCCRGVLPQDSVFLL